MHWQRRLIAAAILLALPLSGCASTLFQARESAQPVDVRATNPKSQAEAVNVRPLTESDERRLRDIVAELQQAGQTDPVALDQLCGDLRQSDPTLWPLVMQQFRAAEAYKQRIAARNRQLYAERLPPTESSPPVAAAPSAIVEPWPSPNASGVVQASYGAPVADPQQYPAAASPYPPPSVYAAPPQYPQPNANAPQNYPAPSGQYPVPQQAPPYQPPPVDDWRQRLAGTIGAMENETPWTPSSPAEIAQHARLRMLYAAAGRREDAMRPVAGTVPAAQEFLAKQMDGMTTWLDIERNPDPASRAAATKVVFTESLASLSELAPLTLRNLAICSEIYSFGCQKRFDKYEFTPAQEVLLYCEIENFGSEQTAKGYHTSLRSNYKITDSHGEKVAEHSFPVTDEYCQNLRHDFFIGFRLRLPKKLPPGSYTLQLVVEDAKCQKSGQAAVQFTAKEGEPPKDGKPGDAGKPGDDGKPGDGKPASPPTGGTPPSQSSEPMIQRLPPTV